jgi:hypothetical protein
MQAINGSDLLVERNRLAPIRVWDLLGRLLLLVGHMASGKPSHAPMVQPLPPVRILVIQDEHKLACKKERETKIVLLRYKYEYIAPQLLESKQIIW